MKKIKVTVKIILSCFLILFLQSCDDTSKDPNVIGGDGNLEQNKVGATYGATLKISGVHQGLLNDIRDSITVTENNNGNITLKTKIIFNEAQFQAIADALGFSELPENEFNQLLDTYKNKYGFSIDTNNPEAMVVEYDLKCKMTSEGIQDYVYSSGNLNKPFTLIKYADPVGSKYEFTESDGNKITRKIIHIDEKESYPLIWWNIKVTKVEEINNDPLLSKIIYYANHKFGLVGVEFYLKNGKVAALSIIPWDNPNL